MKVILAESAEAKILEYVHKNPENEVWALLYGARGENSIYIYDI